MHFILFISWETQYCQFIPHLLESNSYLYSSVFLPYWLQSPPPLFFTSYSLMFSDSKVILVILSWYSQVHIVHFQKVVWNIFLFHKSVFELLFWLHSVPCFDFLLQEFLSCMFNLLCLSSVFVTFSQILFISIFEFKFFFSFLPSIFLKGLFLFTLVFISGMCLSFYF